MAITEAINVRRGYDGVAGSYDSRIFSVSDFPFEKPMSYKAKWDGEKWVVVPENDQTKAENAKTEEVQIDF